MVLSEAEVKNIILKNPNKKLIAKARQRNKRFRLHTTGENLETELTTIEGFEKPTLKTLRAKYAKSNKDLMTRLFRPIDKVFSAKGGSVYFNLPETQDKQARNIAADVRSGYSVKQWIEYFWKPHFLDDPNGVLFMEIAPESMVNRLKAAGKNYVYPTYKSITSIYDYQPNGAALEYIVFTLDANDKMAAGFQETDIIFRVVDDSMDYYVRQEGDSVTIIPEWSMPNLFLKVPGMLNADAPVPDGSGCAASLLDDIIELADNFLIKGSIKVTHDFLHGFPKYSEFASECKPCSGTGRLEGEPCKSCNGTGKSSISKVSDTKLLSMPETKEEAVIFPNQIGAYISPDKTFWEISTQDIQALEDAMTFTIWGASQSPKTDGMTADKTATEIMSDIKPQADRLHSITESAEKRAKFILDCAIMVSINQNYGGATVNYGKRYSFESEDILWEKYSKARTSGAASSVLDDLLLEYYESKYDSDPVKLAIQKKLMRVEPFVHLTVLQLKSLGASEEDYKAKLYFSEWLSTLNDAMILSFSEDVLREQLKAAVAEKQLPQPEKIIQ